MQHSVEDEAAASPTDASRRDLLRHGATALGLAAVVPAGGCVASVQREAPRRDAPPRPGNERVEHAFRVRLQAAEALRALSDASHVANGDEQSLPRRIACFTKCLPHDALGEVDAAAYDSLLAAIRSGEDQAFERKVTPKTLFRGDADGDLAGPYLSQFLLKPVPYLPLWVEQKVRTVLPGLDYLADYRQWLAVQNGALAGVNRFVAEPLYIRSGRDLGEYVHRDFAYQPYLAACLMLLKWAIPVDGGNPYKHSRTQEGFATFGPQTILTRLATAAQLALQAAWYTKWVVHRRLRPEELGGRIHNHLESKAEYPLHRELLESNVVARHGESGQGWLLPQAYPEGCPAHPSYPAAHAVVAGACVTLLKAFFDQTHIVPEPVVASADGGTVAPWRGEPLRIGGELDKLASNIALGRDFAGVHWRSDSIEGLRLGELVTLGLLRERRLLPTETFTGFSLRRFDGKRVTL